MSVAAAVVTDVAGNPNTVSTSGDNTVTLDIVPPTVTGIVRQTPSVALTNASSVDFRRHLLRAGLRRRNG